MPTLITITMIWDSNITKVKPADPSGVGVAFTTSGETNPLSVGRAYTATVTLNTGYILDTVTSNNTNIVISDITENTFIFTHTDHTSTSATINITSKSNISKVSIDLTTLTGWDNVSSGEHTIQVIAKATGYRDSTKSTAVSFTKASAKVLLEAGTYIIKPEPYFNLTTDETVSGKMYTLTANDTYGEQTSFDSISLVKKEPGGLGSISILNSTDFTIISCGGSEWKYLNTDGEEFTLSENTQTTLKIRTIVFETDQYVSQEFYNWVTTQGNFTKDGEQEKYRLIVAVPSIEASINGTKITEYPYILKDNDIILFENKADTSSTTRGIQIFYIENNVQTSIRTHNGVSSGTISNSDVTVSNDNQNSTTIYDFTLTFKQQESTGETWVLNSTIAAPSNSIDENINFLCVDTSQNFIRILVESEGKGVHLEYFAQGDSSTSGTGVLTGGTEVATKYRTLTFETAPAGTLLTWLQANGTKQGGTTTAHTLTITDQYSYATAITVNGNAVTSPYTLQNGDVIKVPTLAKTTINGTSYSTFDESTLNISGEDITVSRSGAEKTTEPVPYITINYTESSKKIINFTIAGTSYQAEEGMTWQQWIDSSYNTSNGKYYISSNGYVNYDAGNISHPNKGSCKKDDTIQSGIDYEQMHSGGNAQ